MTNNEEAHLRAFFFLSLLIYYMAKGIRLASLTLKELVKEYYKQWSGAEDGKCGMSSNPRAQRIDQRICDVLGDERAEEWVNIYSGDGFGKKLFKKYDEIDQQLRDNGVSDRPIFKFARIVCDKFFEWLDAHYDENMKERHVNESNSKMSLFDRILFESNVEIYPENGKLKMTAITPQLMSNRTVNKSTPLEMQNMTHKPSDSTVKTARAVVSLLKDNDAIDEIGNEFDISNGPDMTIMGDGSVKVTPDKGSGKPAHKISKQAIDNKLKTM